MVITDTLDFIDSIYAGGAFNLDCWKRYIDTVFPGQSQMFIDDMESMICDEFTYGNSVLPVLNQVSNNPDLPELRQNFALVTYGLEEKIIDDFGKIPEVDVVLYLGLCNGAGWATKIGGKDSVLLGVEKILELGWWSYSDFCGLVYHELGHSYHRQFGRLEQTPQSQEQGFIWQLYAEGTAMYFEQCLVGDNAFFNQDRNGWLDWCSKHFKEILDDFSQDLSTMTRQNQRYFGDWCDYCGYPDVGYYLAAQFFRFLLKIMDFDTAINLSIDDVCAYYKAFAIQA